MSVVLTIRHAQLEALRSKAAHAHADALVAYAREFHSAYFPRIEPEPIEHFVKRSIHAAMEYDLYSKRSLARFLDVALVTGLPLRPEFDAILRAHTPAEPKDRLTRVWNRMLFEMEAAPR